MMNNDDCGFSSNPVCEVCNKNNAVAFSIINGGWKFTCSCTDRDEEYYIFIEAFYKSARVNVKWVCQLALNDETNWASFGEMMVRFRIATGKPGKRKLKNKVKEVV